MTMSQQQINIDLGPAASHSDEVIVPCYAQCINLQTMHPLVQKRLMLQYKKYYVITRHAINPTLSHLGSWVKLQGVGDILPDGSREWIPSSFFYTNSVIWPN